MPREQERVPYLTEIVMESMSGRREARISDLSVGGCYIDSIADVNVGEEITFELRSHSAGPVQLQGRVVYVHPGNGFGLSFTSLSDENRGLIEEMVKDGAIRAESPE